MKRPSYASIQKCIRSKPWTLLRTYDGYKRGIKEAGIVESFRTREEAERRRGECIGDYWCLVVWDCRSEGDPPNAPKKFPSWVDGKWKWALEPFVPVGVVMRRPVHHKRVPESPWKVLRVFEDPDKQPSVVSWGREWASAAADAIGLHCKNGWRMAVWNHTSPYPPRDYDIIC